MMRDHLFGQEILRQAGVYQYESMIVDERISIEEQYNEVRVHFML